MYSPLEKRLSIFFLGRVSRRAIYKVSRLKPFCLHLFGMQSLRFLDFISLGQVFRFRFTGASYARATSGLRIGSALHKIHFCPLEKIGFKIKFVKSRLPYLVKNCQYRVDIGFISAIYYIFDGSIIIISI